MPSKHFLGRLGATMPLWTMLVLTACGIAPPSAFQATMPLSQIPRQVAVPTVEPLPVQPPVATPLPTSSPAATPTPLAMPASAPAAITLPVASPGPLHAELDAYMTRMLAAQRFQGSVLVAKHGQILLSKGYGWADAELKIGNTAQTRFRLASVSKQFTAFAILHLQAQNKLSVHDSVCRYLADCPPHWQPITIHHLLTHTSGLPNYTNFASFGATRATPTTPQALMARFSDQRLQSSPGAIFQYENSDYVVLGLIIEQVAGQEYADVLHNVVFGPLGMSSSGVAPSVAAVGIDALGYRAPAYPSPPLDPSTLYGCGSLASSVEDLFRWTSALFSGQLLPEAEREQMFTAQARRYGYGWFVERPGGRLRIGHPGKIDGFASSVAHYPEHDLTVIVLSNLWSTDADGISARLVDLVLNNP